MRCKKCKANLNHLQIENLNKDDEGKPIVEVRCFNPTCREINVLSMKGYFVLKKEVEGIAAIPTKIDRKLPSEMNILIVSMERSGSSWLAAHISEAHKETYGVLPKWNHEISRSIAQRKNRETPIGWCSVYNVDIKRILEKDYDKIILLQKDYDALCRDLWLYEHPDKAFDDDFTLKLRKEVKLYWDVMFTQEINDPRVIKVRLEDLNNFTYWEFNRLLDHLEFSQQGRCHIMAVNPPDRNWQVYSDVLPTGMALCTRLRKIQEQYDLAEVEQVIQEKLYFAKQIEIKDTGPITYPYSNVPNPYCRDPEEIPIEVRSFRISVTNPIKDVLRYVDEDFDKEMKDREKRLNEYFGIKE
jgi:hypothetical protein